MAGLYILHPADQWCNFITRLTNSVTSSLNHSVTDIHVYRAGRAFAIQPKMSTSQTISLHRRQVHEGKHC
uniref:Uncharacterized protein n=1 Tax=Anguilla anguilla TaxID=7936 RepID=A0A0E9XU17_ANGAN